MWVALAKAMAVAVAALTVALFTACGGGDAARFTQVQAVVEGRRQEAAGR